MGIALNDEIRRLLDGRHFAVLDAQDPYNYVELRGQVTTEEDVGRAFDIGLSWKYDGRNPDPDPPGAVRLILRMAVDKATGYAA
jgi:hypothetical protein